MNEAKPTPWVFTNQMSRTQTILGWCYLPVHFIVLPLLINQLSYYAVEPVDLVTVNLLYMGISALFVAIVLGRFLRLQYDVLMDRLLPCLLALLVCVAAYFVVTILEGVVVLLLEGAGVEPTNPNNDAITALAGENYGVMKGLSIFVAPIVEEVLFRGVVFGSIRSKNRVLAYAVSAVFFALLHVWQYALTEPILLLYAVQYIPVSLILAWGYERSGSVWVPIFFHMANNAVSFAVLNMVR